jgi:hypothetical protein
MNAKQNRQTDEADKLDDALEGEIGLLYGLTRAELGVFANSMHRREKASRGS